MAEKVRMRVWVVGGLPLLVVIAIVAIVVAVTRKKPVPTHALAAMSQEEPAVTPVEPATLAAAPTQPPPVMPAPRPGPTAVATPTPASSETSPETIPELSELHRPPGSAGWSEDQKAAYRRKVFDDLDARERTLEREEAAARRAGDSDTQQRKAATLAYLREKRALVEKMLGAQEAQQAASAQAVEGDGGS